MRMKLMLAAGVLWFGSFNGLYSVPKAIEAPRPYRYENEGSRIIT